MLINGKRALAYITRVTGISPMDADRLESVNILGWHVVCGKGEFKVGDLGVFIEVDSLCPEQPPFSEMEFLKSKHYKIKTQKIRGVYSQGLFMPLSAFGDKLKDAKEGDDVTELLGITYIVAADNKRKKSGPMTKDQKWQVIAAKHPMLRRKVPNWMKPLFFVIFRNDLKKKEWPAWVVKTDEERVQNLVYDQLRGEKWIVTEKIDGSSATFTMKRRKPTLFDKSEYDFYVCSRNVVFDRPDKPCYYDSNIYLEMAEKYHIEAAMWAWLMNHPDVEWLTLQGEVFGSGVQKRDYSSGDHHLMIFNFIDSVKGRWNTLDMGREIFNEFRGMSPVPVLDREFELPETCDELLQYAEGKSEIDGLPREGVVLRSMDGQRSFKAVSNSFLVKYHGKD